MNLFPVQLEATLLFKQKLSYSGSNIEYIGYAAPGASESSQEWVIMKYTYSGDNMTDKKFAGGNANFDKAWNERANYDYS